MFTGIIDHCGTITAITNRPNGLQITIACDFNDLVEGESIAVDGICLTAIEPKPGCFRCDISPESLAITTANSFTVGRRINLERALRIGDRLGGHWVTGHVEQQGLVQTVIPKQEYIALHISNVSVKDMIFVSKKGSITVNGVSLTINEVTKQGFELLLIPHTLQRTNLGTLQAGDKVNLEFDWLAKVVFGQLKQLEICSK